MQAPLFDTKLAQDISTAGIVAVLVVDEVKDAVPLARALLEGGVTVMELTLRTPIAIEALKEIRREVPAIIAGIGTILTTEQLHAARDAGAAFGVSPGCNPRLLSVAREAGFSFAPGIATPTDIEMALEHGCRLLKYFPAEQLGGLAYLRAMSAPYAHLGVRYVPLGGLTADNATSYLQDPLIAAIGGSWIAPRDVVKANDWEKITASARAAQQLVSSRKA
ncbi:MAG: bifunctional 4-hydroxy-2-oxoglutarate aldolase/2-dehydro-3-deoxy-phosphogluconate aldolase [Chthoniobacterales bacterium]|nr:bifunctional 4-hydroxy-2-oxoglutarate aldolase/2-dehydro-3-deoxy-phosphogluconate aldolase [Chthoniobacterales bacterium]